MARKPKIVYSKRKHIDSEDEWELLRKKTGVTIQETARRNSSES